MPSVARSPEELETLLEDAFVLRDPGGLTGLFTAGAVVGSVARPHQVTGQDEITRMISTIWNGGGTYLALPPRVLQSGSLALVMAGRTVHVVRRGPDGWQYCISWLDA